jgi:hypothetical protein
LVVAADRRHHDDDDKDDRQDYAANHLDAGVNVADDYFWRF